MDEGGEMDSFRYLDSDKGSVVVSRLDFYTDADGVLVSEIWGSEGV